MTDKNRRQEDPAEGSRKTIERELDQPEKGTNHGEGGKKSGIERDADGQYAEPTKVAPTMVWQAQTLVC